MGQEQASGQNDHLAVGATGCFSGYNAENDFLSISEDNYKQCTLVKRKNSGHSGDNTVSSINLMTSVLRGAGACDFYLRHAEWNNCGAFV